LKKNIKTEHINFQHTKLSVNL